MACSNATHCQQCENCHGSAYLVLCASCNDCTYCLGCVALSGKEFHILNRPYTRQAYFEELARLLPGLGFRK